MNRLSTSFQVSISQGDPAERLRDPAGGPDPTAGFQDATATADPIIRCGCVLSKSSAGDRKDFEPEQRIESGLILRSRAQTLMFGGFEIDLDRAFISFVLSGMLLEVIMSPVLAPIREHLSWALWLVPVIYHAPGRMPKDGKVRRGIY